jgi:hypothetical protein
MVAQKILVEATALGRSGIVTHAVDAGENSGEDWPFYAIVLGVTAGP